LFNSVNIYFEIYFHRKDFRQNILSQSFQPKLQNITWKSDTITNTHNLTSTNVSKNQPIQFKYALDRSLYPNQFTGFFIQAALRLKKYPNSLGIKDDDYFIVSTETNIIPEYNPVGDCDGFECLGRLV
jgi:hypothetical protein